jgi:hypothetical protein
VPRAHQCPTAGLLEADTIGRDHYLRKQAEGKTRKEALQALQEADVLDG